MAGFMLTLTTLAVQTQAQMVEDGKKVKFDYTLKVEGEVVETSEGKEPLEYIQGSGQIIPGLAKGLEGLKVGDKKTVIVTPEEAYGEVDEAAIRELPKSSFPEGFEAKEGMVLELKSPEGQIIPGIVWEIKEEGIVLNFNHPLAGKTLEFDVTIVGVE